MMHVLRNQGITHHIFLRGMIYRWLHSCHNMASTKILVILSSIGIALISKISQIYTISYFIVLFNHASWDSNLILNYHFIRKVLPRRRSIVVTWGSHS
jgi:hypothetical protein